MQTEIISRVAEILRNPAAARKKEDLPKVDTGDKVELSADAAAWLNKANELDSEWEREQALKVRALEQKVQGGQYSMNDHMVDQIAERIIKLF